MNKYPRRRFKPINRHVHILGKRNNQRKSACHRGMFSRRRHQVPGLEAQSCGWKLASGGTAPLRSIYKGGSGGPACPSQPRTVTSWQVISRQHGWSCSILHADPCLQESCVCVCERGLNLAFSYDLPAAKTSLPYAAWLLHVSSDLRSRTQLFYLLIQFF